MLSLTKIFHFDASHQLTTATACPADLHGHSYTLEVTISRQEPESILNSTIEDTFSLTNFVKKHLINELDCRDLNQVLETPDPTLEVILREIQKVFEEYLPHHLTLQALKLWQGSDRSVTLIP